MECDLKLDTDQDDIHDTTALEIQFVRKRLQPCTERGKNGKYFGRTIMYSDWSRRKLKWIMVLSLTTALALSAVVLYFYVQRKLFGQAAMVTNGVLCADVGMSMLKKNGSAVEAAIATLICESVVNFESMGIGGGFIMTVYSHQTKSASSLIATEAVPLKENTKMLINTTEGFKKKSFFAVPGELMGYWEAFHKYASGNIKWVDLFQQSIDLCINGFVVTPHLVTLMEPLKQTIQATPSLSEILINPDTNSTWLAGDILRRPKMGATLKKIASEGVQAFYNGSVGDDFIADLKEFGSVMTKEDLEHYQVRWDDTVISRFNEGITLYASPFPDSGPILTFILNILDSFITVCDETTRYQRMIEAFKFAFGQWTWLAGYCLETSFSEHLKNFTSKEYALNIRERIKDNVTSNDPSYYGAPNLHSESKGMPSTSVLAPNGDAVVATSSVNEFLGAKLRSVRTGIIFNNQIRYDKFPGVKKKFCNPPHPTNFFAPHTIPFSSISHGIFVDKQENVRLMLASSGGTQIIPIAAQVAVANLWLNYTLRDAINMPKIYHQLYPMEIHYHAGINQTVLDSLKAMGHNMKEVYENDRSITTGISVQHGRIYTCSDDRGGWKTSGF